MLNRSTETAALELMDRNITAMNDQLTPINIYLDLSKAFDNIDHNILASNLKYYGIQSMALNLLKNIIYWVEINMFILIALILISRRFIVELGPRMYCMYTKPVSDIIQRHGLSHHSYADDTQLYMTMDHSNNDWRDGLARIELCVSEIREWMKQNMLKLNDDKTELIVFTSKYKQDLYNDLSITIGDTVVDCSSQVKDLGVIFDRVLSLRQHVSYTSRACRFHLRNISRIRKYIPQDISIVLIKSLVMS